MLKLLAKELKLTASILSYVFIVFAFNGIFAGIPYPCGNIPFAASAFFKPFRRRGGKRYHLYGAFTGCKKRYC